MADRDVESGKKQNRKPEFFDRFLKKTNGLRKGRRRSGIVAAIMVLVGSAVSGWGLYEYKIATESRRWPTTTGTVLRSSIVQQHFGRENKTEVRFAPVIEYQYFVFGDLYLADRISFGGVSSGSRKSAQDVVDQLPVGSKITVYYHPNTPSTAVLRAGYKNNALAISVGGVLFVIMGVFIYCWLRRKNPNRKP